MLREAGPWLPNSAARASPAGAGPLPGRRLPAVRAASREVPMIGTAEYVNVSPHEWGRALAVGSPSAGPAWRVRSELARQRLQRIERAAVEVGFHPVHGHVIDEDLQIVSDFCGDSGQLPLPFPWRAICARIGQADYLVVHTSVDSPFCIITWSAG